jgi:hypothetical protein
MLKGGLFVGSETLAPPLASRGRRSNTEPHKKTSTVLCRREGPQLTTARTKQRPRSAQELSPGSGTP